MRYERIFILVLDGVGIGSAPDAEEYGDEGSDTLGHVCAAAPGNYPNLSKMGLGNLYENGLPGLSRTNSATAIHGRLTELSAGKDTTTGHWELMGIVRKVPAPTFPEGFPEEFMRSLSAATGWQFIGNYPASGTEIINLLGPEHLDTMKLIVYTSADSVLQIAAHEDVASLDELYHVCKIAREMLTGTLAVDRVIARPFGGSAIEGFIRTLARKDYSLVPPEDTALDSVCNSGKDVIGIGKTGDIFAHKGITKTCEAKGNLQNMAAVARYQQDKSWSGVLFSNLVDFDMLFGHRNAPMGFATALMQFDDWLGEFAGKLDDQDLLVITADHGNDPSTPSTDHSREQVPVLLTSKMIARSGGWLVDPPPGLFHVGHTILNTLCISAHLKGVDLLAQGNEL